MTPVTGALAAAARCLALDQHAAVVTRSLAEHGVDSMILKGPGLARRLYADDPGRRRYSDVDVLVAPADYAAAGRVLAATGHTDVAGAFPDDAWLSYEQSWLHEHPVPLTVDLHRGFAGVTDFDALWRQLREPAEPLTLSGTTVLVPDAVGCALLVGLHAASPGRGRKALADLQQALTQFPELTWSQAAAAAARTGSTDAFAAGLRRLPEGVDLVSRLDLDRPRSWLTRLAERFDLVLLARSVDAVRAVPGATGKLRYVGRRLLPTPDFLRRASPLARRGPAGLTLAYLVRPARLLLPAARRGVGAVGGSTGLEWRTLVHRWSVLRRWRPADLRAAGWAWRALRGVRRHLPTRPLEQVEVPPAPAGDPRTRRAVESVLRTRHATCLERSLVVQRWWSGQGVAVDLVVAVTAPGQGFHAHAWLESDPDAARQHDRMDEIVRVPTRPEWLRRRP